MKHKLIEAMMNEGTLIVGNVVGLFLMFAIPFVAGGLYLLFTGQFKLLLLLLLILSLVIGYFVVGRF
jgi:hypothetical protein